MERAVIAALPHRRARLSLGAVNTPILDVVRRRSAGAEGKVFKMATMNYKTMSGFPVYVIDGDAYAGYYGIEEGCDPYDLDCDMWAALNDGVGDDEAAADAVAELNDGLTLHSVSIEPGFYEGAQIYVKDLFAGEEGWTDAFTQYEFGMDVAEASRESEREHAEIVQWLNDNAPRFGFFQIRLRGVFNDGSGVWERVA